MLPPPGFFASVLRLSGSCIARTRGRRVPTQTPDGHSSTSCAVHDFGMARASEWGMAGAEQSWPRPATYRTEISRGSGQDAVPDCCTRRFGRDGTPAMQKRRSFACLTLLAASLNRRQHIGTVVVEIFVHVRPGFHDLARGIDQERLAHGDCHGSIGRLEGL